jgi:hypothetical protein
MLSLEVREFAEKLNQLSMEDKQWLFKELSKQLTIQNSSQEKLNQQKEAREIISESLKEVLILPDNCYEEVWQKYEEVCTKISQQIPE